MRICPKVRGKVNKNVSPLTRYATAMRAAGAYVGRARRRSGSGGVADRCASVPLGYPGAAWLPATAALPLDQYCGRHPGVPPRPTGWSSRPVDRVTRGSTHEPGLPHGRPWETVPSLVDSTEVSRPNAVIERMTNNARYAGKRKRSPQQPRVVKVSVAGLPSTRLHRCRCIRGFSPSWQDRRTPRGVVRKRRSAAEVCEIPINLNRSLCYTTKSAQRTD